MVSHGWKYVANTTSVARITYPHIYGTNYIWTNSSDAPHNYVAVGNGSVYERSAANAAPIATDVDYGRKIMRAYIWIVGTDEQCVNNSSEEAPSTYQVAVSLAGLAK